VIMRLSRRPSPRRRHEMRDSRFVVRLGQVWASTDRQDRERGKRQRRLVAATDVLSHVGSKAAAGSLDAGRLFEVEAA